MIYRALRGGACSVFAVKPADRKNTRKFSDFFKKHSDFSRFFRLIIMKALLKGSEHGSEAAAFKSTIDKWQNFQHNVYAIQVIKALKDII